VFLLSPSMEAPMRGTSWTTLSCLGISVLTLAACADPVTAPITSRSETVVVGSLAPLSGATTVPFVSSSGTARCGSLTSPLTAGPSSFAAIGLAPGGNTYDLSGTLGSPMSGGGGNPGWPTSGVPGAWIGVHPAANEYGAVAPGTYCFETSLFIPAGATSLGLNLTVRADNYVFVYMNDTKIGESSVLADNQVNWTTDLNITANASEGMVAGQTNRLRIVLVNTRIGYGGNGSTSCELGPQAGSQYNLQTGALQWSSVTCLNPSAVNFGGSWGYTLQVRQYWCSPGYWKNADDAAWAYVGASKNTKYNGIPGSNPDFTDDPTIFEVLSSPKTYGGPATNIVANYLSGLRTDGWGGTQSGGDYCPLNNAGRFVGVTTQ